MKFLMGMICGLVVAIAVPVAVLVTGAAVRGEGPRLQKSTPPAHETAGTGAAGVPQMQEEMK